MEGNRPGLLLVWLRAFLVGAAALLSGTVAHASADGLLPSLAAMLVLLALSAAAAAWFLRRRVGGLRLVVLVLAGQTLVHLALTLLAGHRGDPVSAPVALTPAVPASGHASLHEELMGGLPPAGSATTPTFGWVTHLVHHLSEQAPAMMAAHLVAAVALGLWLAWGEAHAWSALLVTAAWLAGLLGLVDALGGSRHLVVVPAAGPAPTDRVVVLLPQLASHTISHRGPPQSLAA